MHDRPFFFDTVTLANFALADAMHLLVDRYGRRAVLTPDVLSELENGIATGRSRLLTIAKLAADNHLTVASLTPEERQTRIPLLQNLGAGGASCIACAIHRGGIVVTDDRAARATCSDYRIPVTGTIGILLALVRDGTLPVSDVDTILDGMIRQGFYSPVASISCLL